MPKAQHVIALLELGWSYHRIQAETGVRRETVGRYDRARQAKAAKVFPGSPPKRPRSVAAAYRTAITEKRDTGLSIQRIWQDLIEELGYGASDESVKRFVRTLARPRRAVGVFHCAPGAEAQVDFFQGAPTLQAETGEWRRPWVFRMTLGHSRHGYEEAVWDQRVETFLRLHERAVHDLGGVALVIRHDNLRAAVVRACLYDPDINEVYLAFAKHWGFTPLPTQPRHPQENGKQERSGGYVKDNALKGRRPSGGGQGNPPRHRTGEGGVSSGRGEDGRRSRDHIAERRPGSRRDLRLPPSPGLVGLIGASAAQRAGRRGGLSA